MNVFQTFIQADVVIKLTILLLIGMSVMSWKIAIDKFMQLKKEETLSLELVTHIQNSDSLEGLENMQPSSLRNIIEIYSDKPNNEQRMKSALEKETEDLYDKLGFLGSIASSAPFIGLFGTVWGIMNSLRVFGQGGNNVSLIAPMIGEALFVTAIGFIVAIPAFIMFNLLNQKIQRLSNRWLGSINSIINYFEEIN